MQDAHDGRTPTASPPVMELERELVVRVHGDFVSIRRWTRETLDDEPPPVGARPPGDARDRWQEEHDAARFVYRWECRAPGSAVWLPRVRVSGTRYDGGATLRYEALEPLGVLVAYGHWFVQRAALAWRLDGSTPSPVTAASLDTIIDAVARGVVPELPVQLPDPAPPLPGFVAPQSEYDRVVLLRQQGVANRTIAAQLHISESTVKRYVARGLADGRLHTRRPTRPTEQ